MKPINQLFDETFAKKERKGWQCIYVMLDLHGVVIPSNYHKTFDLTFINEEAKLCLQWLSSQKDIKLILWSSSYTKEIEKVVVWLKDNNINIDCINENQYELNTNYADFSKKFYFNVVLEDKAGFEPEDWKVLWRWIQQNNNRDFYIKRYSFKHLKQPDCISL